jgi:hypothetical protein
VLKLLARPEITAPEQLKGNASARAISVAAKTASPTRH